MNWWLKIGAKIVLSRLPFGYGFWEKLSLFKHGSMEAPEYACAVFKTHFDRCHLAGRKDFAVLELGPGDSLFTGILAAAQGASRSILVDVAPFAERDLKPYYKMISFLRAQGKQLPAQEPKTFQELLEIYKIEYLTNGLESLRQLPNNSVDLVMSQAVLEHVRLEIFGDVMKELRRVQKRDGLGSHRVDLRDHLQDGLNNLRFSPKVWESQFMVNSGFYTNRIQFSRMLELFRQADFRHDVVSVQKWNSLPTRRDKLDPFFQALSEDDLLIEGFDVRLI